MKVIAYLDYAIKQLDIARLKHEDAPAASASHERMALLALRLERIPTHAEHDASWSAAESRSTLDVKTLTKTLGSHRVAIKEAAAHGDDAAVDVALNSMGITMMSIVIICLDIIDHKPTD